MKIIILIISLVILVALHVFADTYTVTLDAEQDAALVKRADETHMLPDDFVQELVGEYCDGMIDDEIQTDFRQRSKYERRALARQYLKMDNKIPKLKEE